MLSLEHVSAYYGPVKVLFDVTLGVTAGEVATLLGKNGMGKTTTLRTIFGLTDGVSGKIAFEGESLIGEPTHRIAQRGIALVPEGRQVFPTLTVVENLVATARFTSGVSRRQRMNDVMDLFPRLAERRRSYGGLLSGGEQQMLAIGRALMTAPRLIVLDEASEGLAPVIRREIWSVLNQLKETGLTALVVDKSLKPLCRIGDRHHILVKGRTAWTGSSKVLADKDSEARKLLVI